MAGCRSSEKHPIEGKQPLSNHSEWRTSLDPAVAVDVVSKTVVPFGFAGTKSFWGSSNAPKPTGDYFDQGFSITNAHKQAMNVRVLWIKEGSTQVIVETDLPKDRHEFVVDKIERAIDDREAVGRK